MPWTKERMQTLLQTNDLAVERAVVALYDRQVADEKATSTTKHDNTVGFTAAHARTLSFYARIILSGWRQPNGKKRTHLFSYKMEKARKFVLHYHRQLCDIANAKEQAAFRPSTLTPEAAAKIAQINAEEDEREARKANFQDPPAGSWAETARAMKDMFPDFDWDAWKDEMKERGDD